MNRQGSDPQSFLVGYAALTSFLEKDPMVQLCFSSYFKSLVAAAHVDLDFSSDMALSRLRKTSVVELVGDGAAEQYQMDSFTRAIMDSLLRSETDERTLIQKLSKAWKFITTCENEFGEELVKGFEILAIITGIKTADSRDPCCCVVLGSGLRV